MPTVASLRAGRNLDRDPKTTRVIDDNIMYIKGVEDDRPKRPAGNENRVLREAAGRFDEGMVTGWHNPARFDFCRHRPVAASPEYP